MLPPPPACQLQFRSIRHTMCEMQTAIDVTLARQRVMRAAARWSDVTAAKRVPPLLNCARPADSRNLHPPLL